MHTSTASRRGVFSPDAAVLVRPAATFRALAGDLALIARAVGDGRLPRLAEAAAPRRLATLDGAIGIAGLLAAILLVFRD